MSAQNKANSFNDFGRSKLNLNFSKRFTKIIKY
jgi:hypothetical protein